MLGNTAATIEYDMDNGSIMNAMPNGPDVSVLPNLPLIPKREPIDWNVSFEDTTAFENPVNTIIPFTTPYKIKDPIIVLERCDKFLEVTNLETSREKEQPFEVCNLSQIVVKSVQGGVKDAGIEWDEPEKLVPNSQNVSGTSYIKYQPVLESINNVLPSFRLAVKDKQELFSCLICGQTYVKPYELKAHRRERHGEKKIKRSVKKPLSSTSHQKSAVKATQSSKASVNNNGTKKKDAVEDTLTKGIGNEDSVVPNSFKVSGEKLKNIPTQSEIQKSGKLKVVETETKQSYLATAEEGTGMQTDKYNSVICTLCRNRVTNLKLHLEDYHKICCTDILLAELKKCFSITEISDNQRSLSEKGDKEEVLLQPSTGSLHEKRDKEEVLPEQSTGSLPEKEDKEEVLPQQSTGSLPEKEDNEEVLPEQSTGLLNNNDNELTKNNFNDTGLKHVNAAEEILRYKRKRKPTLSIGQYRKRIRLHASDADSGNSDNGIPGSNTYKCDICHGVYDKQSSFHRHTYKHYIRGETKENFHTFRNVYKNSPLYYYRPIKTRTKVPESRNSSEPNIMRETRSMKERRHTTAICTSKNSSANAKSTERFTCICGRSFRFAYNLFIHRNHVKCGESKMTTSNNAQKKNTTHTDSSAGISLTIKKKDHLYQVINTNSVDKGDTENIREFKGDDLAENLLDINHPHSTDDAIIIDEVHKYSKDHIILKLESGEEDSVINIEDDSDFETSSKCPGKQSTVQSTTKRRTEITDDITDRTKEFETNKVAFESVIGALTRTNVSNIAAKPEATANPKIVCTCNKKFVTFMSLHRHVIQTHPLLLKCGYCKIKLHSLDAYQSHVCQVVGKPFDLSTNYISCYRCNTLTKSFKEFDKHNAIMHPSDTAEYKCIICYKSFTTLQTRQSHIDRCHDTHRCTICGSAVRASLMRIHEGYHHGFGIPCHPCKKAFLTVKRFDKHMVKVHKKCMPSTVRNALLPNLMPSVSPSGPENCGICNKIFDDERSLRYHILTAHEATYPWFKCQECHMFAATNSALQHHIKMKSCSRIRRKTTHF